MYMNVIRWSIQGRTLRAFECDECFEKRDAQLSDGNILKPGAHPVHTHTSGQFLMLNVFVCSPLKIFSWLRFGFIYGNAISCVGF